MNAGDEIHAWNDSSSFQRVSTSQVVRSSVGRSSSKPSKPGWSSTAPARAAKRFASSTPLAAGTVVAGTGARREALRQLVTAVGRHRDRVDLDDGHLRAGLVEVAGDLVDEVRL